MRNPLLAGLLLGLAGTALALRSRSLGLVVAAAALPALRSPRPHPAPPPGPHPPSTSPALRWTRTTSSRGGDRRSTFRAWPALGSRPRRGLETDDVRMAARTGEARRCGDTGVQTRTA